LPHRLAHAAQKPSALSRPKKIRSGQLRSVRITMSWSKLANAVCSRALFHASVISRPSRNADTATR